MSMPPVVFVSYSHADELWKKRLLRHLRVLELEGYISTWTDREIEGGADWESKIQGVLERASLTVLLVSPDFLTSHFIRGTEVPRLLQRRVAEGLLIYPILVRPSLWQEVPWLASIQFSSSESCPIWARAMSTLASATTT